MLANDVGNVMAPSPLLVLQGTADTTVVPERTRDLFARLCATGQVTEYSEYEGAGHQDIGTVSAAQVTAWVADRFADEAPTDSCPDSEPPPPEEESTPTTTPPARGPGGRRHPGQHLTQFTG